MIIHQDYPFPVRKLFLDQMEIAYVDVGKGSQCLVFVHGFASYLPVWAKNIQSLRKYYRCLALDLPGHGLSSSHADYSYSISFYAETVTNLLKALGLSKIVLVGHSMGGQIAVKIALKYPEYLSHLILVAPAGFETFSPAEQILLKQFAAPGIFNTSQYLKLILNLKNYFYELNEKEYTKLQEFSRSFYSLRENPLLPIVLYRSVKGMMDEIIFELLPEIKVPTLICFGKEDRLIPNRLLHRESTETIARRGTAQIPDAQLKLYAHCGHFLQYEYPVRFSMDLYKFLNPLIFGKTEVL